MNERPELNPHTGQPYPAEPDPRVSEGAPAPASGQTAASASPPAGGAAAPPGAATSGDGAPAQSGGAPTQQELAVRSALETVMDPEIGLSVIDLGLIREIHFQPDRTLVRMMLTTPFCPYAPQL
ncbi:MAG TPA: iron-sulfur cluster assembly protein, partial [Dongiaceae bacterium]|nr:iron-sulfur cluster assembly protein [Dongiaceae bacterium]